MTRSPKLRWRTGKKKAISEPRLSLCDAIAKGETRPAAAPDLLPEVTVRESREIPWEGGTLVLQHIASPALAGRGSSGSARPAPNVSGTPKFLGVNASSGLFTGGTGKGLEINSGMLLTTGSFALWNQGNRHDKMDESQDNNFPKRLEPESPSRRRPYPRFFRHRCCCA